jgi:DNA-binding NtrC family response regulator
MDRPLRLLMVENTDDDAELLLRALRRGGYEVACEVVETPAAMRAALERQEWDVITSDHAMPHFGAPAALALAKALRPGVPFIVVSGELDLNLAVSLLQGGAQDYIQKQELARLGPAIARELREVEIRRARPRAEAVATDEAPDSQFSMKSDTAGSHTAA